MSDVEVLQFKRQAWSYVRCSGNANEDVVSEMVLLFLTDTRRSWNMRLLYLKALDRLNPRHRVYGIRHRRDLLTVPLEWEIVWHDSFPDVFLTQWIARLPHRPQQIFTRMREGWLNTEIAQEIGVSAGRITQIVTKFLSRKQERSHE